MKRLIQTLLSLSILAATMAASAMPQMSCPSNPPDSKVDLSQRFVFLSDSDISQSKAIKYLDSTSSNFVTAKVLSSHVNADGSISFQLEKGGSLLVQFGNGSAHDRVLFDAPGGPELIEVFEDCTYSVPEAGVTAHN